MALEHGAMWPWLIRVSQEMSVLHWVHCVSLQPPAHRSKRMTALLPLKKPQPFSLLWDYLRVRLRFYQSCSWDFLKMFAAVNSGTGNVIKVIDSFLLGR